MARPNTELNQPIKPPKPPKSVLRKIGRAIVDYAMIREGDRILLGVSGGKDSLSLLHLLRHFRSYAPVRFELGAMVSRVAVEQGFVAIEVDMAQRSESFLSPWGGGFGTRRLATAALARST